MKTFKIGQRFHYTGDMANFPGIAEIVGTHENESYGQAYTLKIWNDCGGGDSVVRGITAAEFEDSPGRRFIPWEEYLKDRQEKIARLSAQWRKEDK